jgi:hypothetical protein
VNVRFALVIGRPLTKPSSLGWLPDRAPRADVTYSRQRPDSVARIAAGSLLREGQAEQLRKREGVPPGDAV